MSHTSLLLFCLISFAGFSQRTDSVKAHAQKILDGSIQPLDDEMTFRALDSLFCRNPADKDFYFKVANKIRSVSDGALSEYVSVIARRYYFDHNMAFINHVSKLSTKEVKSWLSFAAFEVAVSNQSLECLPALKKKLAQLVIQCHCAGTQKALIRQYNSLLYKEVETELKDP